MLVSASLRTLDIIFQKITTVVLVPSSLCKFHAYFCYILLELKNISMNLRVELWRDPLIESIGWWLECVLLPLGMNVVYSHVQFRLRMNEIFKSKDCLIQSLNGTKLLECQQLRLLDCQQLWLLGASVGQPTVVTVGSKGCNLSLGSNLLAPPGALYKELPSLNWKTPTTTPKFRINSLSLSEFWTLQISAFWTGKWSSEVISKREVGNP